MQTIVEYFDPCNKEHVDAYHALQTTGIWSKSFIPYGTEFPNGWQFLIMDKLASAWIKHILTE